MGATNLFSNTLFPPHFVILVKICVDPTSLGIEPTKWRLRLTYLLGYKGILPNKRECDEKKMWGCLHEELGVLNS